jgi:hypothetical protein
MDVDEEGGGGEDGSSESAATTTRDASLPSPDSEFRIQRVTISTGTLLASLHLLINVSFRTT